MVNSHNKLYQAIMQAVRDVQRVNIDVLVQIT